MSDPTKPEASAAADGASLSQLRHDFCTPINQILGYSQMLQEDAQELGNAKLSEDLRKIEAAGKRLLEMVDKLVSGVRAQAGSAPVSEPPSRTFVGPVTIEQPDTARSARARLLVVDEQLFQVIPGTALAVPRIHHNHSIRQKGDDHEPVQSFADVYPGSVGNGNHARGSGSEHA